MSKRVEVRVTEVCQTLAEEGVQDRCPLVISFWPNLRLSVNLEEPAGDRLLMQESR